MLISIPEIIYRNLMLRLYQQNGMSEEEAVRMYDTHAGELDIENMSFAEINGMTADNILGKYRAFSWNFIEQDIIANVRKTIDKIIDEAVDDIRASVSEHAYKRCMSGDIQHKLTEYLSNEQQYNVAESYFRNNIAGYTQEQWDLVNEIKRAAEAEAVRSKQNMRPAFKKDSLEFHLELSEKLSLPVSVIDDALALEERLREYKDIIRYSNYKSSFVHDDEAASPVSEFYARSYPEEYDISGEERNDRLFGGLYRSEYKNAFKIEHSRTYTISDIFVYFEHTPEQTFESADGSHRITLTGESFSVQNKKSGDYYSIYEDGKPVFMYYPEYKDNKDDDAHSVSSGRIVNKMLTSGIVPSYDEAREYLLKKYADEVFVRRRYT